MEQEFYEAIPGWIAGMAMVAAKQNGAVRHSSHPLRMWKHRGATHDIRNRRADHRSGPDGRDDGALALATYGVRCTSCPRQLDGQHSACPHHQPACQRGPARPRVEEERDTPPRGTGWATRCSPTAWPARIVRLQTWGTGDDRRGDYLQGSPCTMLDIPAADGAVADQERRRAGRDVSFNTEYVGHEQDADGVTALLRDGWTGTSTPSGPGTWSARTAPGRRRRQIGLQFEGGIARAGTAYIIFNADLSRYGSTGRASCTGSSIRTRASARSAWVCCAPSGRGTQWIAGWGFDMAKGEPDLSEASPANGSAPWSATRRSGGRDRAHVGLVRQPGHATKYSKGRVSAAATPCTGTRRRAGWARTPGCRTRSTSAWKVAFVVKGHAGGLLDTYTPSGRRSASRSCPGQPVPERLRLAAESLFPRADAEDPVAAGVMSFPIRNRGRRRPQGGPGRGAEAQERLNSTPRA